MIAVSDAPLTTPCPQFILNMVLELLRSETGPVHRRLEDRLDIQRRLTSVEDYRHLLGRFYGLYSGLERRGVTHGDGLRRTKSNLLKEDLRSLGLSPGAIGDLPHYDWPVFSAAAGLGAFYVVEGSTLGGQFISRMAGEQLGGAGVGPQSGARFFHGYGDQTRAMWQAARDWLESENMRLAEPEEVVKGALRTFEAFEHWLCAEGGTRA